MHFAPLPRLATAIARGRTNAWLARLRRPRGIAAIALASLHLFLAGGAGPVLANDLSTSPCTAGDVEIVGSGTIVNEPCACTPGGTFNARVQFTVRNNTSTGRYCIALHLVPDGAVLTTPVDVVLRDANGSSTAPGKSGGARYQDTIMFGTIPNFPCNAGVVCFGQAGVVRGKCEVGTCTTVSWNTSPGAAGCSVADETPPGGQCRHQQICVVGFGATLACTANCTPGCGESATLRACVTAPASRGPFTLALVGDDGSSASQSAFGDASGTTCVNFTVTPTLSPRTTYTLTVTDREGCTRTATTSLDVAPATVTITPPSNPGCNGVLTYTASVAGRTDCTFTWKVDGQTLANFLSGGGADDARIARVSGTGNTTFQFRALDNTCHTILVESSCQSGTQAACTGSATARAKQCVGSTLGCQ